jgi:hypothetical protein
MTDAGKQVAQNEAGAIDLLIEILSRARLRPEMYFNPIGPASFELWLNGLNTGVSIFGLAWKSDHRKAALAARGLELKAIGEADDLRQRGLSPSEVVDELLSIEIEMWQSHRSSIV